MKRLAHLLVPILCIACGTAPEPATTAGASDTTGPPATVTTAGSAGTAGDDEVTVTANDFSFAPSAVTIKVGESVTWTLSEGAHTTTSGDAPDPDGMWNQALTADEPFAFTFEEPGTYQYLCRFHPDFMTGMVTVEP